MLQFIKKYSFPVWFTVVSFLLIIFAVYIRFQGLGYSNFQGDEVNTIDFLYMMKDGVWNYLMSQKRGPVQYLLNIFNTWVFGYHGEVFIRLPYMIFGVLALLTTYNLARKIFDRNVALIAVLLMSVNGLFIAFARITQYQALMYFLVPIAVWVFIKSFSDSGINYRNLTLSGVLTAVSLLIHYDTMSVMPFFIIGFLAFAHREIKLHEKPIKEVIIRFTKGSLLFFTLAMGLALVYYVPFYTNQAFDETTSGYLQGRLFGGEFNSILNLFMPGTALSLKLLTMYIPKFFIYLFFVLGLIGIASYVEYFDTFKIKRFVLGKQIFRTLYLSLIAGILFVSWFSLYPIKPRASSLLVLFASLAVVGILTIYKRVPWYKAALVAWFLGAYCFYFYIMRDARTHVYVSMMPLFILAGQGVIFLLSKFKYEYLKWTLLGLLTSVLVFVSGVNYVVFADRSPEYPWWDKDFLGYEIYRIKRVRHEKIEGVFGFNNYRGWEQVANLYEKGCLVGTFNSNEKNSITYFYLQFDQKKLDRWEVETDADNMIIVEGPHSWQYYKAQDLPERYKLLHTIYSENYPVTFIYGNENLYPEGRMLCEETERSDEADNTLQ